METMTQRHSTKSHEMCHKRALQTLSLLNFYANIFKKKKHILNIKRGDLQITPLFWFVDRVPKKSSAIFGCNKTHALKTHRWGHKKSPGRWPIWRKWRSGTTLQPGWMWFPPLVGIRFRKPDVTKSRPTLKKEDEPVFCKMFLLFLVYVISFKELRGWHWS